MNNKNTQQAINIFLSRKELQVVLDLLETTFIPGLDADPLGDLTNEQQSLALTVAEHALQARQLIQVQANDKLVDNTLLKAVGVCAYSQNAIFILHWPAQGEIPTRYFGHIRQDGIVAHTRPKNILHKFSLLPSKEHLIEQVLTVCQYENLPTKQTLEFTMSGAQFVKVRELVEANDTEKAVELLVNNKTPSESAKAFIKTLAHSPRISVMQTLSQEDSKAVQRRDFTLLQNSHHTWLIIAPPDEEPLQAKTVNKDKIHSLLAEWL